MESERAQPLGATEHRLLQRHLKNSLQFFACLGFSSPLQAIDYKASQEAGMPFAFLAIRRKEERPRDKLGRSRSHAGRWWND